MRVEKIKKEDNLYNEKKTKMFGMLLRAKRQREEQEEADKAKAAGLEVEVLAKRQDFCMMYVIQKHE